MTLGPQNGSAGAKLVAPCVGGGIGVLRCPGRSNALSRIGPEQSFFSY